MLGCVSDPEPITALPEENESAVSGSLGTAPNFLVQGVPMDVVQARKVITTDTSLSGWGAIHKSRIGNGRRDHLTNVVDF